MCRNPAVAAERARKRAELLAATEAELDKVRAMVQRPARDAARAPTRARSAHAPASVINKYKVAKHFSLQIADGAFAYRAQHRSRSTAEAALDGLYVIRTTCPPPELGPRRGRSRLQTTQDGRARLSDDERPRSRSARSTTTSKTASAPTRSCACSPTTSPSSSPADAAAVHRRGPIAPQTPSPAALDLSQASGARKPTAPPTASPT